MPDLQKNRVYITILGIELIVINMGKKGLSKLQREEIYQEVYSIVERNKNRINYN
jgi:hypothetical protein